MSELTRADIVEAARAWLQAARMQNEFLATHAELLQKRREHVDAVRDSGAQLINALRMSTSQQVVVLAEGHTPREVSLAAGGKCLNVDEVLVVSEDG